MTAWLIGSNLVLILLIMYSVLYSVVSYYDVLEVLTLFRPKVNCLHSVMYVKIRYGTSQSIARLPVPSLVRRFSAFYKNCYRCSQTIVGMLFCLAASFMVASLKLL